MTEDFAPPTPTDVTSARLALDLTQTEAAAVLGADRVTWARYEGGTRNLSAVEWRYWLHVTGLKRLPFGSAKATKVAAAG